MNKLLFLFEVVEEPVGLIWAGCGPWAWRFVGAVGRAREREEKRREGKSRAGQRIGPSLVARACRHANYYLQIRGRLFPFRDFLCAVEDAVSKLSFFLAAGEVVDGWMGLV